MPNMKSYGTDENKQHVHYVLEKAFQSANINFLIGSGASLPAIQLAKDIEQDINDLLNAGKEDEARKKKM